MSNKNTKASDSTINDKQFKLYDFIPEFSKFRSSDEDFRHNFGKIDDNLYQSYRKGCLYFKSRYVRCNKCKGIKVTLNATIERKLIFLNKGLEICLVQQFKCKQCGATIPTDMSTIVRPNSNITYPVIEHIIHLYSYFSGSLRKIQKSLKVEHSIEISHQSIENIILFSDFQLQFENWSFSGYYIFDALWVRKDGKWWYLLCLFDVKLNTIVARSLVESETTEVIENFFKSSLRNQNKKCITTDLKIEYRDAIDKLDVKHQFCLFHTKQKINRDIKEYNKNNNLSDEEIKIISHYKRLIFDILDADDFETANYLKDMIISNNNDLPKVIHDIMWKFIVPNFKRLTYHLHDKNIEHTSNKLENCFLKNFNKSIKKLYKSEDGILKRFDLKLNEWNEENRNW